jgi:hypothetical protein
MSGGYSTGSAYCTQHFGATVYNPATNACVCSAGSVFAVATSKCTQPVPSAGTEVATTTGAGTGVTLAELVELFIALDIIPPEKAAQPRAVTEQRVK